VPPAVDLAHELRLIELLVAAVAGGEIRSAHDVSDGGLAVALAECCFAGSAPVGARVALGDRIRLDALLFGESTGRVIAATDRVDALLARARAGGVPAQRIGVTGGDRLRIGPPASADEGDGERVWWIDRPVAELRGIWERGIPRRLEVE